MSGCVEEKSAVQQGAPGQAGKLWFKLGKDPSEGALSISVPKGWGLRGENEAAVDISNENRKTGA